VQQCKLNLHARETRQLSELNGMPAAHAASEIDADAC